MKLETFFEKFDLFADAPNAVEKMRELIIKASVTIRSTPSEIKNNFKLMGRVSKLIMGQAPKGIECNTNGIGTVFVKVGEFGSIYPNKKSWTTNPLRFAKTGDVLVCVVGATVGKLNLAIDCAIGRSVAAIRPDPSLDTKFLYYSLIPHTLRLRKKSRGSAQGVIGKDQLNGISLWIPSISTQRKIVTRLDELMALCDQLEAKMQERKKQNINLLDAAIESLTIGMKIL